MSNYNQHRFSEVLEYHLNVKLQQYGNGRKKLERNTMEEIYQMIYETINTVFSKSSRNLSENAKKWISQKYYECIRFSESKIISEDLLNCKLSKIYDAASIKDIPAYELEYISNIFNESSFYDEIEVELKNRN